MEQKITVWYDVETPMRDGVVLRANVYGPADDRPYPAILLRFPYLKDSFEYKWGRLNPLPLARAGYRVVVQDCRGTGASQGEMDFDGPCQARDGYDTVEWIAAQPWCDGGVGMYGLSYYGFTQLLTAEAQPPHLKAICPWQQTGLYKYSGGFTTGSLHLMWLLERARDRLYSPEAAWSEDQREMLCRTVEGYLGKFGQVVAYVPEGENPAAKIEGLPFLEDYLRRIREYDDPACPAREGRPIDFSKFQVPCFFLGGWYDDTSKNGPLENWIALGRTEAGRKLREKSRLLMGPWNHGEAMPDTVGWRSFGAQAGYPMGRSITEQLLRFFNWHLKGLDDGISQEPPVTLFFMGENRWEQAPAWPLPDTVTKALYLSSSGHAATKAEDGRLLTQPETEPGQDTYISDPANPVPARAPGISSECQDQSPIEARADVAVYTSEPLTAPLAAAGPVKAVLYVSSSCPDTDFACKLTEVFPDGRSLNITDGAVRVSYGNTWERKLLTPGEIRPVEVLLGNTLNVFQPGSRIRLTVAGSMFPKFDRNHHLADRIGTSADMVPAEDTIHHGGAYLSRLELQVLERKS